MSLFNYESWIGEQSEEVKAGIEEHYNGLLNTVKATRDERDALSKELKSLAKNIDENSEAGKQLGELRTKLAEAEKKSIFMEQSVTRGVKRPSAAYAIANADNLYLKDGQPDWDKIKESVPELFTPQSINSDAGSGTSKKPEGNFNTSIRKALEKKHNR